MRASRFLPNDRGAVAVIFSITFMAVGGLAGAAFDYSRMTSTQKHLQTAADAAALAGARVAADGGATGAQKKAARESFAANCTMAFCDLAEKPTVDTKGEVITVTANATVPATLLQLVGIESLRADATSQATFGLGQFVDAHFVVDVSGSFEFADDLAEADRMRLNYRRTIDWGVGCSFACHDAVDMFGLNVTYNGKTANQIARDEGIYLRIDRVRDSLIGLAEAIEATNSGEHIRLGLFTFDDEVKRIVTPSEGIPALKMKLEDLDTRSHATDFDPVLSFVKSRVGPAGDGTKAKPKQVVVLITDGVQHSDVTLENVMPIDVSKCTNLKDAGYELYVMHIEYPERTAIYPLVNSEMPVFYVLDPQRGAIIQALKDCASPGRFYEGKYASTITDALLDIAGEIAGDGELRLIK
ncbi:TadE/TadG family type IV pilus assembly protein [Futiania mangrovi]|uniref:VWA domain-containing protein n=1 Tax=Futiania mangrovi TaxID=2959716 RepID=A0A9J6PIE8_9PROT|nr:VWA domain-containing protein [Futiania mangrovii]MCP1335858.1 VWA domain-containing protein [Futiania mangrovii]